MLHFSCHWNTLLLLCSSPEDQLLNKSWKRTIDNVKVVYRYGGDALHCIGRCTALHCTTLGAVLRCTTLGAVLHCTALGAVLHCTTLGAVLHCTALGAVLHCTALHWALYCIALHWALHRTEKSAKVTRIASAIFGEWTLDFYYCSEPIILE